MIVLTNVSEFETVGKMYLSEIKIKGFKKNVRDIELTLPRDSIALTGTRGGAGLVAEAILWGFGKAEIPVEELGQQAQVILALSDCSSKFGENFDSVEISCSCLNDKSFVRTVNGQTIDDDDFERLFLGINIGEAFTSYVNRSLIEDSLFAVPEKLQSVFYQASGIATTLEHYQNAKSKLSLVDENLDKISSLIGPGENDSDVKNDSGELSVMDSHVQNRNELMHSRDELLKSIRKVEASMAKSFEAVFKQISKNFDFFVGKLFTDYRVRIESSKEEAALRRIEGINIVTAAGLNQQFSDLSDEKKAALNWAMALAIYMINPSPCVIFEDVDLPRDDTMAANLLDVVREFGRYSQLVFVSCDSRFLPICKKKAEVVA